MVRLVKIFNTCVCVATMLTFLMVGIFTIPQLFRIAPFVVRSGSMEPNIPTGSVVFVNKNATEDIRVGDIVTFGLAVGDDNGVLVTHRVYKIDDEKNMIQTKGDANNNPDGFMAKDAIVGKVICYIPKIGFLLGSFQSNYGYIMIILALMLLNVFSGILNHAIAPYKQQSSQYNVGKPAQ